MYVLAEREDRAGARVIAIDWFVLVPLRFGEVRQDLPHLRRETWRSNRLSQKAQTRAAFGADAIVFFFEQATNLGDEGGPGARFAAIKRRLGTIGIVEPKDRGLGKNIARRRSAAAGMFGIAFDLRGSSFVAAHEQRRGNTAQT